MKVKSRVEVVNEAVDRLMSVALGNRKLDDPTSVQLIQELPLPICIMRALARRDTHTAEKLLDIWAGYDDLESEKRSMK